MRHLLTASAILLGTLLIRGTAAASNEGEPDPAFGTVSPGRAVIAQDLGGSRLDRALGVGRLTSGGYLMAGWSTLDVGNALVLQFLTSRGSRDTTRPNNGRVVTAMNGSTYSKRPHIAPDGRVTLVRSAVSGGRDAFAVDRVLPSGMLDAEFGSGGTALVTHPSRDLEALGLALSSNGDIVVYGRSRPQGAGATAYDPMLFRLTPGGQSVIGFGTAGLALLAVNAQAEDFFSAATFLPDGRVLACGAVQQGADVSSTDLLVVQTTTTGSFDGSWGSGSLILDFSGPNPSLDLCMGVGIGTNDRRLVLAERSQLGELTRLRMVGLAASGGIDVTYGGNGNGFRDLPFPSSTRGGVLAIDNVGRALIGASVVLVGEGDAAYAGRLRSSGLVDTPFGALGTGVQDLGFRTANTLRSFDVAASLIDRDRLVIAGDVEFAAADRDWALARTTANQAVLIDGFE